MRNRIGMALVAWSLSAGLALAQGVTSLGQPTPSETAGPAPILAARDFVVDDSPSAERFWFRGEYLLWWSKNGPLSTPLATIGSDLDAPLQGVIGQPNTRVAIGGSGLDFGSMSGFRLSGGIALSADGVFSLEAGWLQFERRSLYSNLTSNATGDPVVARPFVNAANGRENVELDSSTAVGIAGSVAAVSSSRLSGWEINFAANRNRTTGLSVNGLLGFRALSLTESITIQDAFRDVTGVPGGAGLTFLGAPVLTDQPLTDLDSFRTSNHFYGPQVGGRVAWNQGMLNVGLLGKLAMGCSQELVVINGASSAIVNPGDARNTVVGGVLAQSTNIDRHFRNAFAVVPEIGLDLGVQLTDHVRIQIGYSFLYWSNVVRPGDTIDRTVNPTLIPTDQAFAPGAGPARPAFAFHSTDYWAQGINFGVQFRY